MISASPWGSVSAMPRLVSSGGADRFDYTANANAVVLAARLCDEAAAGQIVVSQRIVGEIEHGLEAEPLGDLTLKGFAKPMRAYNVIAFAGLVRSSRR
jgi:adenylate cyclase